MTANETPFFDQLLQQAQQLSPLTTAVVHAASNEALLGAIQAHQQHLINPIFIGPTAKLMAIAEQQKIDLSKYELIDTEHSHAAAMAAVALVRAGKAEMIMKGSLHSDELLSAMLHETLGIRTERRISHVFVMEVPKFPRLLLITDAAINIQPTLMEKRDIVQNAIDLALAIGIAQPKVAILSAVETISVKLQSTIDAASLCKMAERQQIVGGVLDGPLALDNAISEAAAKIKEISSPVAGHADILVVPDLVSGNLLAKQLDFLQGANSAGLVLGARVPVVLTSRANSARERVMSCALALLCEHYKNFPKPQKELQWHA